jgi:hypothetical protein
MTIQQAIVIVQAQKVKEHKRMENPTKGAGSLYS